MFNPGDDMLFRRILLTASRERKRSRSEAEPCGLADSSPKPPRGPGLFESMVWFLGAWGLHVLGLLLTAAMLSAAFVSVGVPWGDLIILEFLETQHLTLIAGEQFLFVSVALVAAWLRLRGNLGHRLSSRPLPLQHLFLLSCLVIPLATICGQIHQWGMVGWKVLLEYYPHFQSLDTLQAMDLLKSMSADSPLWALLLVIAVAPALGEELIFRGVIGRGLISRWGVTAGILMTSFLFAIAHVHPVHALAVFPMGLVLHYVYYTTRSFWAPLFVHFCNNAWAVLLTAQAGSAPQTTGEGLSFSALLTVTLSLAIFLAFLWQTRVHYLQADGTEWTPEKSSLELPVEIPLRFSFASLPLLLTLGGLVPFFGFLIAITARL